MTFKTSDHTPECTSYDAGDFLWCRCQADGVDSWATWEEHMDELARADREEAWKEGWRDRAKIHAPTLPGVRDSLNPHRKEPS